MTRYSRLYVVSLVLLAAACGDNDNNVNGNDNGSPRATATHATAGPTPTRGPTETPAETNTVETVTPTPTESSSGSVTPTVTPTASTATPTPTVDPSACPQGVEVVGNAGSNKVLDSGWTGLGHNATVVSDGKLTFELDCTPERRPCGTCNVSGPVQNQKADAGDINAHRCTNDTSIKCTDSAGCSGGTCEFFFGAPLPLAAGGINTCVVNQVRGSVTGTANVESGAFATSLNLLSKVYNQVDASTPCPQCNGTDTANDGKADGTCSAGARQGQKCDVNGVSPVTSFGSTSLDCPPVGLLTGLNIALSGSSGTETKTLDASSPNCQAVPSKKCLCPPAGSVPNQPNACLDDSSTPGTVEGCVPLSSGSNKGQCEFNPGTDQFCSPFETFRGCLQNTDCPAPGDTCVSTNRPCFLDNGVIGGSVTAVGHADPPDANGVSNPTFASLFCIPPVASVSINTAAGLPGLGRIELPLISHQIQVLH